MMRYELRGACGSPSMMAAWALAAACSPRAGFGLHLGRRQSGRQSGGFAALSPETSVEEWVSRLRHDLPATIYRI